MSILEDVTKLIYPPQCSICNNALVSSEELFCLKCLSRLPLINNYSLCDFDFCSRFIGRIKINYGFSFLNYQAKGDLDLFFKKIKYHGVQKSGYEMGKIWGLSLIKNFNKIPSFDYIVPVPMHKKKIAKRGFNQAEEIANGLASIINVPVETSGIEKIKSSSSQTKKDKILRFQNLKGSFELKNPQIYENKHILLLDDIITTGATLESLASEISRSKTTIISICALAMTKKNI